MKYTGHTKAELIECCQCLEHNYNVMKERFERVSDLANEEANRIVNLRTLLKECKNEFIKISTMACYPETRLSHPADFDELFNKCEEKITRINAAIGDNKIQANPVADIKIQESEE